MSTNFYGVHIPTLNDWERRRKQSLEEASDMKGLIPIIEEYYELCRPPKIHIGKRSVGWVFLFAYNQGQYYTDKASLQEFLKECQIEDEYGDMYFFDEFWKEVEACNTWKNEPAGSHIEYIRKAHAYHLKDYKMIDELEFADGEWS